jgi:hypothetical protein
MSSWLTCLLLNQPLKEHWLKAPIRSKLLHGTDSETTCYPLVAKETLSLNSSLHLRNTKFLQHSLTQSKKVDLAQELLNQSNQKQSEPPWIMWHMPLSWLANQTQNRTMMGDLHSFYNLNSSSSQTMTNQFDNYQQ